MGSSIRMLRAPLQRLLRRFDASGAAARIRRLAAVCIALPALAGASGCDEKRSGLPPEPSACPTQTSPLPINTASSGPRSSAPLPSAPPGLPSAVAQKEEPFTAIVAYLEGLETEAISVNCLGSKPGEWRSGCDISNHPLLASKLREFEGMLRIVKSSSHYSKRVRDEVHVEVGVAAIGIADRLGPILSSPRWPQMRQELAWLAAKYDVPLPDGMTTNEQLACLRGLALMEGIDVKVGETLADEQDAHHQVRRHNSLKCLTVDEIGPAFRGARASVWVRFHVPSRVAERTLTSLRSSAQHAVARLENAP